MSGLRFAIGTTGVLLRLLATPAGGQDSGLRLVITDPSGAVLPGVMVSITGYGERAKATSLTADGAGVAIAQLAAGAYHLRISGPGFWTSERDVIVDRWAEERLTLHVAIESGPTFFDSPPPIALIPSNLTLLLPEARLHRLVHR